MWSSIALWPRFTSHSAKRPYYSGVVSPFDNSSLHIVLPYVAKRLPLRDSRVEIHSEGKGRGPDRSGPLFKLACLNELLVDLDVAAGQNPISVKKRPGDP